tara:strand:- start:2183 stop:3391 length:1209 start_codon:yes stop_codon:yes gene_type:complete
MKCRSCGSKNIVSILNLGNQPWCNDFLSKDRVGKEKTYPLNLICCSECELLQLSHTVPKETMFADHCYLSGMTKTLVNHFHEVAKENINQFNIVKDDLVVDIGGNDGSQLMQYQKLGIDNILNVECAKRVSEISKNNGVPTISDYFNKSCVEKYIGEKSVKLYNASGVFFHLEELRSVIEGIKLSLREDGVLIVQFMYAGTMIEKLNFDTIYHEHLLYYTLRSLQGVLSRYGLEIFDAYYSEIHSGSIIAKITHTDGLLNKKTDRFNDLWEKDSKYTVAAFHSFAKTIKERKDNLKILLTNLKKDGKTIYAYGAPAKGNTLLNYFEIDNNLVDKAVEINELKIGNYLPGSHIPITKELQEDTPGYYLLLSHNFEEEIIKKNKALIDKGVKFIIPFPEIKIVS